MDKGKGQREDVERKRNINTLFHSDNYHRRFFGFKTFIKTRNESKKETLLSGTLDPCYVP